MPFLQLVRVIWLLAGLILLFETDSIYSMLLPVIVVHLYRLSSISLTQLVHPQLRRFLARTLYALMGVKVQLLNAPLRLISAATLFSMKMGVVPRVLMSRMNCILTWFSGSLLLEMLILQLPLFLGERLANLFWTIIMVCVCVYTQKDSEHNLDWQVNKGAHPCWGNYGTCLAGMKIGDNVGRGECFILFLWGCGKLVMQCMFCQGRNSK
jgi:hypothetical protein